MGLSPAAVQVDAFGKAVAEPGGDPIVVVEYRKVLAVAGPTYLLLIDKDNAGGKYKHVTDGPIHVHGGAAAIVKEKVGDQWRSDVGVILSIDGSEAVIGYLEGGSVAAINVDSFVGAARGELFPIPMSLEVDAGDFKYVATNYKDTDTNVTTGSSLEDIGGVGRAPVVGDAIIKVERLSGSGQAQIFYTMRYRTVG